MRRPTRRAILAIAVSVGVPIAAPAARADAANDRARAMDQATEAFLIGTWTFSKADPIGSRTLYLRFDKNHTASLKVSGDSNILPRPLTAQGVFWKVNSISETAFLLEVNADQMIGGGMHDLTRRGDGTMVDRDGTTWTRVN